MTGVNMGCVTLVFPASLSSELGCVPLQPPGLYFVPFSRLSELFIVQDDGAVAGSPTGWLLNKSGLLNNVVSTVIVQKVF